MAYREIELAASAARTASGNGDAFPGFGDADKLAAQLVVSSRSGTNPTLDVVIQHSIDGGSTWFDLISFTQATAAGNELKAYSDVQASSAQLIGDRLRAKWTIGGTNTPTFTFSVKAISEEDGN